MAAREIDRLIDPSATHEEHQRRKRRLIYVKGPREFRAVVVVVIVLAFISVMG